MATETNPRALNSSEATNTGNSIQSWKGINEFQRSRRQAGCQKPELLSRRASWHRSGMQCSAARAQSASRQQLLCSWRRAGSQLQLSAPGLPKRAAAVCVFGRSAWLTGDMLCLATAQVQAKQWWRQEAALFFLPATSVYQHEETLP